MTRTRLSDGWRGRMIEGGYVRRILECLADLEKELLGSEDRSRR